MGFLHQQKPKIFVMQLTKLLQDSLNTVQFYNTTITSIVSSDNAGKGTTDTSWIQDAIIKIGQYNSLIAWLKEAIKNKEEALGELSSTCIQVRI